MIKHILVPTDGSEQALTGAAYAVGVAKHLDATVHGLHVVDIKLLEGPILRDVSASLGTAPFANYQGNIGMILDQRGDAAIEAVSQRCATAGVPCKTERITGIVARTIVEQSALCDLIVLGRSGEHSAWLGGLLGSTTEAVVRHARTPVLVTGHDAPKASRFVIAYDGSPHAKHALGVAAEYAAAWGAPLDVLVVSAHPDHVVAEAKTYLEPHGLATRYEVRDGDPSETIVAYAGECGADLLIMGAYGHTKVRELVVGSTTSYAMNHAPCPLLLTR
ncbi:MAG: universal stress protein [Candidatus Hydrogenedentes bacterium]|nr:universal stress protein [Candidatus Hydrogenedentota bacterium]